MKEDKIKELLDSLGSTPDEVAAYLAAAGIKGYKRNPCHCPLAVLVNDFAKKNNYWDGLVVETYNGDRCVIRQPDPQILGRWHVPKPVAEFAIKFDSGHYPQLDAGGSLAFKEVQRA